MTREIKFRAWDSLNRKMAYDITETKQISNIDGGYDVIGFDSYLNDGLGTIVMQYTGLKDINAKEIYEGDIISFGSDFDCVIFSFGAFHLERMSSCYCRHVLVSEYNHQIEVVGNICENPELLEV